MVPINYARWVAGGVVAGVVILALMLAGLPLVGEPLRAEFAAHKLSVEGSPLLFGVLSATMIVLGLLLVFLYAAARPRFGAGPRTAVIVALALWVGGPVVVTTLGGMAGLFHGWMLVFGVLYDLVVLVVGSLVGAWMYREPAMSATSAVSAATA